MTMSEQHLTIRWVRRYKIFFLLGFVILGVQVFLAFKSLDISGGGGGVPTTDIEPTTLIDATAVVGGRVARNSHNSAGSHDDEDSTAQQEQKPQQQLVLKQQQKQERLTALQLGFEPVCDIEAKEAISALQRAKTKDCRKHIAQVACAIQSGDFSPATLPSYCPSNHTANAPLGCYRDEKETRLLAGYFIA